jgi:hypothetical protein
VQNPSALAIRVTSITVTPLAASRTCAASNLTSLGFSGSLRVAARSSAQVTVNVQMRTTAPDACQKATFPLQYRGSAVAA